MNKKIQAVKFKTVGELLDFLPEKELHLLEALRALIFECMPECEERLAYNVPFYYHRSRICFLWPASVPWGRIEEGVKMGFSKGYLLGNEIGYLNQENRKKVFTKTFITKRQINRDRDLLKAYLFEALALDEG